eukprot:s157_g29.t1
MAAFEEAGYVVTSMLVCPSDAKLPVTRGRIHYLGVHRDSLMEPCSADKVLDVWKLVTKDAKHKLSDVPLDAFLWGSYSDEEVQKVPSVQQRWSKTSMSASTLPLQEEEGPEKKKRRGTAEAAWPELHKQVKPEELRDALDLLSSKGNRWFQALTDREKQIVAYLDVKYPLAAFTMGTEQVCDVLSAQIK